MKNKRGSAWIWILLILILIAVGVGAYFLLSGSSGIPQPPALPESEGNNYIIRQNFGSLNYHDETSEPVEGIPVIGFIESGFAKYGSTHKVVVVKYDNIDKEFMDDYFLMWSDAGWERNDLDNGAYDFYMADDASKRVALWVSDNLLIVITSTDGFHGDGEDLAGAYLDKYPVRKI